MSTDPRLLTAKNIWVATTRKSGKPHLVPIWFVWVNGCAYICTSAASVKAHNMAASPWASFALEDGSRPVIAECDVRLMARPFPGEVVQAFVEKYAWSIANDAAYDALFELKPVKWLRW